MMWGYGYGFDWLSTLLMSLGMLLWVTLLVVLVWAVIRWLDRKTTTPASHVTSTSPSGPSALEILQQRYARGEIDTATYEQMRERLTTLGRRDQEPAPVVARWASGRKELMMGSQYGFGVTLRESYEEVIPLVEEALKVEGFGVLTEIDVRQTLREKLGAEMEPYLILGACNPILAHRALDVEPEIGLLLPCNVVVRAIEEGCRVEIADPQAMLGIVGNEQLDAIAGEAKQRLQRAVATLER